MTKRTHQRKMKSTKNFLYKLTLEMKNKKGNINTCFWSDGGTL